MEKPGTDHGLLLQLPSLLRSLVTVAVFALGSSWAVAEFEGMRLHDALLRLQSAGVPVVFSDALVTDDMVVGREPGAVDPRTQLSEILAEHQLTVEEGPGGRLIVVPAEAQPIEVGDGEPERPERIVLKGLSIFLNEIIVTPSHFRILEETPVQKVFLSHEDVAQMPHAADDLYRAVKRLPGAAGGDYTAEFSVRGGEPGELLVLLDGVELFEPFHLKDFQNMFSTIDAEAVGGVDFLTGGFPVEYGDRMSGVMDINSATPRGPPSTSIAVSTLNARAVSKGTFDDRKGQWMINARAWYPARVADRLIDLDRVILADYYDLFAKVNHAVGDRSQLSANALFAMDDLSYFEDDEESFETVAADYRSHQMWLNLRTDWTPKLDSRTVLSTGRIHRDRIGGNFDVEDGTLDVSDRRQAEFFGLRQDWRWEIGDEHYLKWGLQARRESADFHYRSHQRIIDFDDPDDPGETIDTSVDLEPSQWSYGAWIADRFRIGSGMVAEVGLRWDKQTVIDDHQLSPRINLRYELGKRSVVRAAWGLFHQSQRLHEMQVEDGVGEFYPAQQAEHVMLSMEHLFPAGTAIRFEAYRKNLDRLRPRYENLFNPIEVFPEASRDRVRVTPEGGRSEGFEILIRDDTGERFQWWLSYGLAWAEDRLEGRDVPRSWDQRNATSFGWNWRIRDRWNVNLAGTWHSGWPTTPVRAVPVEGDEGETEYDLVLGPRNSARLPDFLRFDLRATRRLDTRYGQVEFVMEILNVTNRKNLCCLDDFEAVEAADGTIRVARKESYWAPMIPSLGVSWTF